MVIEYLFLFKNSKSQKLNKFIIKDTPEVSLLVNHSVHIMFIAKPTIMVCAIFLSSSQHSIICFVLIYIIRYYVVIQVTTAV